MEDNVQCNIKKEYDAICKRFEETLTQEQKKTFYKLEMLMEKLHENT